MLLPLAICLAACSGELATLAGPADAHHRAPVVADSGLRWSDAASWPDGRVPVANADVVVPEGRRILLDVSPPALRSLVVRGTLALPLSDTTPRTLVAGHIEVRGALEAGSEQRPYPGRFTITLTGVSAAPGLLHKAISVFPGASLELHGRRRLSWTRLARTAEAGATQLVLAETPDWGAGDRIVVASSTRDQHEAESRIVRRVEGRAVTLDAPLGHRHLGDAVRIAGIDVEHRAEVGLLTRGIRLEGDAGSDASGEGAHVIVFQAGFARVDGVEFHRVGQRGELARYPMHWHMASHAPGQYIVRSSVWRSFNRCVTVHGTHDVTVADNVCYDHTGHGFFLEDGIETNNSLTGNLGLLSRTGTILGSDGTPATFWITNPDNTVDHNVAAGSAAHGFWYAVGEHPTGPSATADVWPLHVPVRSFRGNLAHASADGLHIEGVPGQYDPRAGGDPKAPPVVASFVDFTAYENGRAYWSRASRVRLERPRLVGNAISVQAGEAGGWAEGEVDGGLIAGWAIDDAGVADQRRGVLLYDGPVSIRDVTFANFDRQGSTAIAGVGPFEGIVSGRFRIERSRFVDAHRLLMTPTLREDGERLGRLRDVDGSVTGIPGSTVVPNDPMLLGESCEARAEWNAAVCRNGFATITLEGGEGSAPAGVVRADGLRSRYNGYTPSRLNVPVRTRTSYTIVPDAGPRTGAGVFVEGLDAGDWVVVAVPVSPDVAVARLDGRTPLPAVETLADLAEASGMGVHFDRETGLAHLRLVGRAGIDRYQIRLDRDASAP